MDEIKVNLPGKKYGIHIQKGIIDSIGLELKKKYEGKKIAIITDANVNRLYGERLEGQLKREHFSVFKIIMEPGEKSKSFEGLQKMYTHLLNFGITRNDLVVAFGGGVIGDVGGFAAATFMRGVPFIQIPTSLIAQIDSSIGGKVAVNLSQGKNLVGTFYHPEEVFIDPNLIMTLEERYFYDGIGEVIKYGAIKDAWLFYALLTYNSKKEIFDHMEEIIKMCCTIKKEIVEKDEKDKGERMLLNFGHTIGHAVEHYYQYDRFTHGEAVAIGMYQITKNSELQGITEKSTSDLIKKVLMKYHLPYEVPSLQKEKLMELIRRDKKGRTDTFNIVLLRKIGDGMIKNVSVEELEKYVV